MICKQMDQRPRLLQRFQTTEDSDQGCGRRQKGTQDTRLSSKSSRICLFTTFN